MIAPALKIGDTISIVSPSHVATPEGYAPIIAGIEALGFRVKLGKNLYHADYGYASTEADRIADFNAMAVDDEVQMVFFGGGEGSIDLLSHLDYAEIARHPKIYLSYSDGTSILEAIYAHTGLCTYYGMAPRHIKDPTDYAREMFFSHLVRQDADELVHASPWRTLNPGVGEGTLIGGYNWNFALLQGSPQYPLPLNRDYLLFIEDHEKFGSVPTVSMFLSHVEQSRLWSCVRGLIFGNYADEPNEKLYGMLARLGKRNRIPVVYCDDFGHGANSAILPIGRQAVLDANAQRLIYR